MTRARVLVVDDKPNFVKLVKTILEGEFDVKTASDGAHALAVLAQEQFDVVVSDIRMPGADGFTILRQIKHDAPDTEVVLMTAFASVAKAVEAMRLGAHDYLTKPFEPDEALLVVRRAAERKRLREQARNLSTILDNAERFEGLVGNSAAMQRVFGLMRRAADTDATVLIRGESGTGKELVARAIHLAGPRAQQRFVPVNCGAIPETLIESELFGHVRGAFTGAAKASRGLFVEASGGTIFLDEIGELPLGMQVKLTRVLQEHAVRPVGGLEERKVDVRVVSATNVDLKTAVAEGRFREDLYYRLNVFPIELPPLRERREDIPALAALFLQRHAGGRASKAEGFTAEAIGEMTQYHWPGNVRELENCVLRALAVSDATRLDVDALPDDVRSNDLGFSGEIPLLDLPYKQAVEMGRARAAHQYLAALLERFGGNVREAAAHAGIERESLHRLLRRYRLRPEDFRASDSHAED